MPFLAMEAPLSEVFSGSLWVVLCFFVTCVIVFVYLTNKKYPLENQFSDLPPLPFLLLRGFCVGLIRRQGVLLPEPTARSNKNNKPTVLTKGCRIDRANLAAYNRVCGVDSDVISPCYLEILFLKPLILLVSSDQFRLCPLGLIHIKQTITQYSDLQHLLYDLFDLEVMLLEYISTPRGIKCDVSLKVFDRQQLCVWEGVVTYLSRYKNMPQRKTPQQEDSPRDNFLKSITRKVHVASDLGLRYAKVSGDWNPHHLWPFTARFLGYKRPIAQGMWTLAYCLADMQRKGMFPAKPPFHIDASFKRPLFMPGTSSFRYTEDSDEETCYFHVEDDKTGVSQLTGSLTLNR